MGLGSHQEPMATWHQTLTQAPQVGPGSGPVAREGGGTGRDRVGKASTEGASTQCPSPTGFSVLFHGQSAAIGPGLRLGLERKTLDETPGEAAGFLPGARAGVGIWQVIV